MGHDSDGKKTAFQPMFKQVRFPVSYSEGRHHCGRRGRGTLFGSGSCGAMAFAILGNHFCKSGEYSLQLGSLGMPDSTAKPWVGLKVQTHTVS